MGRFVVLSRVDALVDYITEVEADDAQEAADIAYEGGEGVHWKPAGITETDVRRVVTLSVDGEEMESTARGE